MPHLWRSWLSQVEGHDEEAPHDDEQRTLDRHEIGLTDLCKMAKADDIRKYTLLNLTAKDIIYSGLSQKQIRNVMHLCHAKLI